MTIENHSPSSQRTACCRILALEPSATHQEIKSAYKRLALKWHPDRHKSQKEYAKDRFVEIHEAYQTLMNLTPMPPPMSRNTSGFASPPPTPASRPADFYSQSAGSTSSWSSSGPSSNPSTPRTSADELPTPKASKHSKRHSKTSTDGFRRTRTRTLSRVKRSDRAQFTRTESSTSSRSNNSSKSHHSSSRHHHSSRSRKSDRPERTSSDRHHPSSSKGKEKSSSKHSHSRPERSPDRFDKSERDDHRRHRSHRHRSRSRSWSRSRSRSRDRPERSESSRHSNKGKEREGSKDKDVKVEEPETKREKAEAEKKPTKPHKKSEKEGESSSKEREKMEKVEEEADDPPPPTAEPPLRPPIIGIPLRPSRAPDTTNSDWIFPLPLTLEELYSGTNYRFQITRQLRNPPKPDSHPTSTPKSTTSSLDGESSTSTIHVNIDVPPGGYKNMTQMRFEGIGNQRKSDGTFQDIVFVIQEVLHDRFIRIQDDLVARIELTWDEALQKEDIIIVDGLDGEKVEVPIPKVPDDSKETRIPKAGMPVRNSKDEVIGRGDLVIRWEFVFPQKQSNSKWQALKSKFSWQSPKATAS